MQALLQHRKSKQPIPSAWVEYAYYLSIAYSTLGPGVGLLIPVVGGGLVFFLAAMCILQLRSCAKKVYSPIGLLLACAASFVLIQAIIHDESLNSQGMRSFIIGILNLIIVHSLCRRRGFYLRYPLVLVCLGLVALPFLTWDPGTERARADASIVQGELSHPNSLSEWFGFCAVHFAIVGMETKRLAYRVGGWLLAVGCLFVVGLAVSRAPIFGAALAITVAFRGLLKRGFVPVLLLVISIGVIHVSGLFDPVITHYSERGMEESGREELWPEAIRQISAAPVLGVGASEAGGPHNTFLFFAASSGIVPLAFFIAFWVQAAWRSALAGTRPEGHSFRMPYLLFTFVSAMFGDLGVISKWAVLALPVAAGSVVVEDKLHRVAIRVGNKVRPGLVKAGSAAASNITHRRRF